MAEDNNRKHYQPKDIRSPWLTIYLLVLIGTSFYTIFCLIFDNVKQMPLKDYIFLSLLSVGGIWFCSLLIYNHCAYCTYVMTTDDEITGKTLYKFNKNIIKFNEIKEIWITKRVIIIHLKDIHGNRLGILFGDEFIPVLKELLEKSVNCTRIDFNYDYIMKKGLSQRLPEIKPFLDKRLAEIKEKEQVS